MVDIRWVEVVEVVPDRFCRLSVDEMTETVNHKVIDQRVGYSSAQRVAVGWL